MIAAQKRKTRLSAPHQNTFVETGVVRVLHLEDDDNDAILTKHMLEKQSEKFSIDHIKKKSDFEQLDLSSYDLYLVDFNLVEFTGIDAIKYIRQHEIEAPIIIVSGSVEDDMAVDLLTMGANDFVLKGHLVKLPLAIKRVMHERKILLENRINQEELTYKNKVIDAIFNSFKDPVSLKDQYGRFLRVNTAFSDLFEAGEDEIIGRTIIDIMKENPNGEKSQIHDEYVIRSKKSSTFEFDIVSKQNEKRILEVRKTPVMFDGHFAGVVSIGRDITELREQLSSTQRYQTILDYAERLTNFGSFEYKPSSDTMNVSGNLMNMLGINPIDGGGTISLYKFANYLQSGDQELFLEGIQQAIRDSAEYHMNHCYAVNEKDGVFDVLFKPVTRGGQRVFYGTILDVTDDNNASLSQMSYQEEDRNRLALELHDNLGQKLVASSLLSHMLVKDFDAAKLGQLSEILQEALRDLRLMINTVSTRTVEIHSMKGAVEKLFELLDPEIDSEIDYQLQEEMVPHEIKVQMYRIIQEALNNVNKYSKAKTVKVTLRSMGILISLIVEDDGVGFDMDTTEQGFGINNIHHRARVNNGLVSIKSAIGEGTKIEVKLPVRQ